MLEYVIIQNTGVTFAAPLHQEFLLIMNTIVFQQFLHFKNIKLNYQVILWRTTIVKYENEGDLLNILLYNSMDWYIIYLSQILCY